MTRAFTCPSSGAPNTFQSSASVPSAQQRRRAPAAAGPLPEPRSERRVTVVIVGGGIAGLSAGWKLQKAGFHDFEILELEGEAGGNARFGQNAVSAYPWGAHYVPFPTRESRAVRELLRELGAIWAYDAAGRPVYEETFVCNAPEERLFIYGKWQDGLLPLTAATATDLESVRPVPRHHRRLPRVPRRRRPAGLRHSRWSGARATHACWRSTGCRCAISCCSTSWIRRRSTGTWTTAVATTTAAMRPMCRRGPGCTTSPAAKEESATPSETTVLTWPEGNGWIVRRLKEKLAGRIRSHALVFRVQSLTGRAVAVDSYDPRERLSTRVIAEDVVFACPTFLARFLMPGLEPQARADLAGFDYAPWLVANLTLRAFPLQRAGVPISWDNVIYDSPSLGYVVATHQSLQSRPLATVLTYYHALAGLATASRRTELLQAGWERWVGFILHDLSKPHPEIRDLVTNLDIMLWGHAMICPRPGFVWGEARQRLAGHQGPVLFAHSDLSGFSLFEEAQYRGVLAAEEILHRRTVPFASSL